MKKITLSIAALLCFTFANAQETTEGGFNNGDVFITGSVGFGSNETFENKTDSFTFSPAVGKFFTSNIAAGLSLQYGSSKVEEYDGSNINNKATTLGITAFGRYYFTPTNKFSFFGHAELGYVSTNVEPADVKINGFGFAVAPGISYFVSSNLALEASFGLLSYTSVKPDFEGADSYSNFNLGVDMTQVKLGMIYKF